MMRVSIPWHPQDAPDGSLLCVVSHDISLKAWGIDAIMPAGFESDGMSVPRFFWRFIGPRIDGTTIGPAIVHDWLYKTHLLTRKQADRWLFNALRANGYSAAKSRLVYCGVRIGGFSHW